MGEQQTLLYSMEGLPVFQNRVYDDAMLAKNCPRGDLELCQDLSTGLLYNRAFKQELMVYDRDYQNEQACSPRFRDHLRDVERIISRHMDGKRIVEVGCGKGYFLEQLLQSGYDAIGCDPTYEGDNPRILKQYFSSETGIQSDAIVLRHVLEHVADPYQFLLGLARAKQGCGLIYIEVPCMDWIVAKRAWFDIFYEHVNYFRLQDFANIFSEIIECGHVFSGQYLYAVANLSNLRMPSIERSKRVTFPADFKTSLADMVTLAAKHAGPVVVWGASSKGVIFTMCMLQSGGRIDHVVDINPAKQGRYIPVSGKRIESPDELLSGLPDSALILVMNGNYLEEIRDLTQNRFNYHRIEHDTV